jgi:hypothetical protein
MNRTNQIVSLCVPALLVTGAWLYAGPLNPPAGPVTPSYKTLAQVEPRIDVATLPGNSSANHIITQPGSYYLSQNVLVNSPTGGMLFFGVSVQADDVTLDLGGFAILQTGTGSSSGAGVHVNSGRSRVAVRNGTISGFLAGVSAVGASGVQVRDVAVNGISAGIDAGADAQVENCRVTYQGFSNAGIRVGAGSIVSGSVATCSGSNGRGFVLGDSARAIECTARAGSVGFELANGASIDRCTAADMETKGVTAASNNSILECNIRACPTGIDLTAGGTRVERCKIGNATIGVRSAGISTIVHNTLNAAVGLTGTGIELNGQDDHVEANYIYTFATGVQINGGFATVLRNSMHFCASPVGGSGVAGSIAPIVGNASALAANPVANTSQ